MDDMDIRPATLREHQLALLRLLGEFDRVCKMLDIPYVLFAGTLLGAQRHGGFVPWDDDLDVLMLRRDYDRFLREAEAVLDGEVFFLQKEFSPHWPMFFSKLRLNNTACIEKFHPRDPRIHQGIYIDIFPCDDAAASELGRRIQFAASKVVIAKCLHRRGYDTEGNGKKLFLGLSRLLPMGPMRRLARSGRETGWVHSFFGGARAYGKNVYRKWIFQNRETLTFEGRPCPVPADRDALLRQLYGDYTTLPTQAQREQKRHAILVDLEHSYERYEHLRDNMEFDVLTRSIR